MRQDPVSEPGFLETDKVLIRMLSLSDLDAVVKIDNQYTKQNRKEYYRLKIQAALQECNVRISLAAEIDGFVVGFLMGAVYYGDFGTPEPVAIVDSIGVAANYTGQSVGAALMRQLKMNLKALNVETIRTQVDWDQWELLRYFKYHGFKPAPRLCLEHKLEH